MHKKNGFLLVSFLMYLMFFSIITFCIGHIITSLIIPSFFSLKKNQSIISLHIAGDFFIRDVRNIKENKNVWKKHSPHELIWEKKGTHIGWLFLENRLERKEGIYNGTWREYKKSMIANGISSADFNIIKDKNDNIIGLKLVLTSQYDPDRPVISYVAITKK